MSVPALLFAAVSLSLPQGSAAELLREPRSVVTRENADPLVVRANTVDFDLAALAPGVERVRLALFQDTVLVARLGRRETTAGGFVWSGRIEGTETETATLAVVSGTLHGASGTLHGHVQRGDALYRLRGRPDGSCLVEEIDATRFPPCRPPIEPRTIREPPGSSGFETLTATMPVIDVLVVYTPAARAAEGGTAAIEALIDVALAQANQAYAASSVLQRLRLVGRAELTGYVETVSFTTELGRLTLPADGWLDHVHPLRDACGADVVCMLIENSSSCGVANAMTVNTPADFSPYAFAVSARACAVGNLTFAHELGHVMGLAHDRDSATRTCSRASLAQGFTQGSGPSGSPSVSRTGQLVAFTSDAPELVPGDTNGIADVFLRERSALQTTRVHVATNGAQANGPPVGAPVVTNGRFVAFASSATNLAPGDTNGVTDIFLHDRLGPITTRVSPGPGGVQADGPSWDPGLSATEQWVTFTSSAPNLGASAAAPQVYRYQRLTGALVLVSATPGGAGAATGAGGARIADDGRFVAFWSASADLVAGDTNGTGDVFVRDVLLGTTERISLSTSSGQIAGPCLPATDISADGRWILFATASPDVVAGDANGATDLFVRDRVVGATLLVSATPLGAPGGAPSSQGATASISDDGRYVAFASRAGDLVSGDTNGAVDVFLRDVQNGTTERVSVTSGGAQVPAGGGIGTRVALAGGAGVVAFATAAPIELGDTNGVVDVYAFDRAEPYPTGTSTWSYGYRTPDAQWRTIMATQPGTRLPLFSNPAVTHMGQPMGVASPSPYAAEAWRALNDTGATVAAFRAALTEPYCFGDGSGTACPCGNASDPGSQSGCRNSLLQAGQLTALGGASLGNDSLVLSGAGMPDSSALYFQGTVRVAAGAGNVLGDGLRCAGGTVQRLGLRINFGGRSALPAPGGPAISTQGGIATPGTYHYQVWYRNAAAFCTPSTFNLTNAVSVAWQA